MNRAPGLAKVRRAQAVSRRVLELVAVREGWWSAMLERADIVSEGAMQRVAERLGYYGSTSLRCIIDPDLVEAPAEHDLASLILADPHARLRLLRLAHREAMARAGAPVGVLNSEMTARVLPLPDGREVLAIDIDVSAEIVLADDRAG